MLKFKKDYNLKIISVIVAGLFLLNSTVYGIDLPNKSHLRKQLIFSDEKERPRVLCIALAVAISGAIRERKSLDFTKRASIESAFIEIIEEMDEHSDKQYMKTDKTLLELMESYDIAWDIDKEAESIWVYHRGEGIYLEIDNEGTVRGKNIDDFQKQLGPPMSSSPVFTSRPISDTQSIFDIPGDVISASELDQSARSLIEFKRVTSEEQVFAIATQLEDLLSEKPSLSNRLQIKLADRDFGSLAAVEQDEQGNILIVISPVAFINEVNFLHLLWVDLSHEFDHIREGAIASRDSPISYDDEIRIQLITLNRLTSQLQQNQIPESIKPKVRTYILALTNVNTVEQARQLLGNVQEAYQAVRQYYASLDPALQRPHAAVTTPQLTTAASPAKTAGHGENAEAAKQVKRPSAEALDLTVEQIVDRFGFIIDVDFMKEMMELIFAYIEQSTLLQSEQEISRLQHIQKYWSAVFYRCGWPDEGNRIADLCFRLLDGHKAREIQDILDDVFPGLEEKGQQARQDIETRLTQGNISVAEVDYRVKTLFSVDKKLASIYVAEQRIPGIEGMDDIVGMRLWIEPQDEETYAQAFERTIEQLRNLPHPWLFVGYQPFTFERSANPRVALKFLYDGIPIELQLRPAGFKFAHYSTNYIMSMRQDGYKFDADSLNLPDLPHVEGDSSLMEQRFARARYFLDITDEDQFHQVLIDEMLGKQLPFHSQRLRFEELNISLDNPIEAENALKRNIRDMLSPIRVTEILIEPMTEQEMTAIEQHEALGLRQRIGTVAKLAQIDNSHVLFIFDDPVIVRTSRMTVAKIIEAFGADVSLYVLTQSGQFSHKGYDITKDLSLSSHVVGRMERGLFRDGRLEQDVIGTARIRERVFYDAIVGVVEALKDNVDLERIDFVIIDGFWPSPIVSLLKEEFPHLRVIRVFRSDHKKASPEARTFLRKTLAQAEIATFWHRNLVPMNKRGEAISTRLDGKIVPTVVIPHGTDPLSLMNVELNDAFIDAVVDKYDIKTPYILQLARFVPYKNHLTSIYSFMKMVAEHGEKIQHHLVLLVDTGPQELNEVFRRYIASFPPGLQERVHALDLREYVRGLTVRERGALQCLGYEVDKLSLSEIDSLRKNALQRRAAFGLQPSMIEAFSSSALELEYKGVPIIGSNRGGIPGQVPSDDLLVEFSDEDEMAILVAYNEAMTGDFSKIEEHLQGLKIVEGFKQKMQWLCGLPESEFGRLRVKTREFIRSHFLIFQEALATITIMHWLKNGFPPGIDFSSAIEITKIQKMMRDGPLPMEGGCIPGEKERDLLTDAGHRLLMQEIVDTLTRAETREAITDIFRPLVDIANRRNELRESVVEVIATAILRYCEMDKGEPDQVMDLLREITGASKLADEVILKLDLGSRVTSNLLASTFFSIVNTGLTHTKFSAIVLPKELAHAIMALRLEDLKDGPAWLKATYLCTKDLVVLLEGRTNVDTILKTVREKKETGATFILADCLFDPKDPEIQALMKDNPVLKARVDNHDYVGVNGLIKADAEMINFICGARPNDLPIGYIESAICQIDGASKELPEWILDALEFGQVRIEGDDVILPNGKSGKRVKKSDCYLMFCGGGDCPGLNSAIAGAAVEAHKKGKYLLGVRKGFEGVCKEDFAQELVYISPEIAEVIQYWPTTMLLASRFDPFKDPRDTKEAAKLGKDKGQMDDNCKDFAGVFVTGGDDNAKTADKVHEEFGIPTVWIPKSIDNDAWTLMIGFMSAVEISQRVIIEAAYNAFVRREEEGIDALVLEIQGRGAGHLALWAAIKNIDPLLLPDDLRKKYEAIKDTIMILVPEEPVSIQQIVEHAQDIQRKYGFVTVVVAEGFSLSQEDGHLKTLLEDPVLFARFCKMTKDDPEAIGLLDDLVGLNTHLDKITKRDPHGHPQLGGISHFIRGILENSALGGFKGVTYAELGYIGRGSAPNEEDRKFGQICGQKAVELLEEGKGGLGVTLDDGKEIAYENLVVRPIRAVVGTVKEPNNKLLTHLYTPQELADAGVLVLPEHMQQSSGRPRVPSKMEDVRVLSATNIIEENRRTGIDWVPTSPDIPVNNHVVVIARDVDEYEGVAYLQDYQNRVDIQVVNVSPDEAARLDIKPYQILTLEPDEANTLFEAIYPYGLNGIRLDIMKLINESTRQRIWTSV